MRTRSYIGQTCKRPAALQIFDTKVKAHFPRAILYSFRSRFYTYRKHCPVVQLTLRINHTKARQNMVTAVSPYVYHKNARRHHRSWNLFGNRTFSEARRKKYKHIYPRKTISKMIFQSNSTGGDTLVQPIQYIPSYTFIF